MSAISAIGSASRRPRKRLLIVLASMLVLATAFGAERADAMYSQTWSDLTTTSADAGCTQKTWLDPVAASFQISAIHHSYATSNIGTAYVKFAVWDIQRARWASWDTNWTQIPPLAYGGLQFNGLSGARYGAGTFAVYATFYHNGATTAWNQIGWMRFMYSSGRLLCFNS